MEHQSIDDLALSLAFPGDVHSSAEENKADAKSAKFRNKFEYQKFKEYLRDSRYSELSNLEKFDLWMWKQRSIKTCHRPLKAIQHVNQTGADAAWLRIESCLNMLWESNEKRMAHCCGKKYEGSENGQRWKQLWTTPQEAWKWKRESLVEELLDSTCQSMDLLQFVVELDKEFTACLDLELIEMRKSSLVSLRLDQLKLEFQEICKEEELELQRWMKNMAEREPLRRKS